MKNAILITAIFLSISIYATNKISGQNVSFIPHENGYGVVDKHGNILCPTLVQSYEKHENYYILTKFNKKVNIDTLRINLNDYDHYESKEGRNFAYVDYSSAIMSTTGEFLTDFDYHFIEQHGDMFCVSDKSNKFGLINSQGVVLVDFNYEFFQIIGDGLVKVMNDRRFGIINMEGEIVLPCIFTLITNIFDNTFLVNKDSKYGLVNSNGDVILPWSYDMIFKFENGYAKVIREQKIGLINDKGEFLLNCDYDNIKIISDTYLVQKDKKFGLVGSDDNVILPFVYDFISSSDNLLNIYQGGKLGIANMSGEVLIPCLYQSIAKYGSSYIARKDNYYGIIDSTNKPILPFRYLDFDPINDTVLIVSVCDDFVQHKNSKDVETSIKEGYKKLNSKHMLHTVYKNKKFGVVDTKGRQIIPCRYESIEYLSEKGCFMAVSFNKKIVFFALK